MSDTHLVLLHSPLVGHAFWQPVAERLCQRGLRTHAPRLPSLEYSYAPFWLAHAAGIANGLPDSGAIILAAHSAAGVLLPAIGRLQRNRRSSTHVRGYLFVDCDLPRDGATRLELWDDQAAANALRERVGTGYIPRWSDAQLRALLPDDEQRARFLTALPQLPIQLYDESVLVPDDWPDAACAYLQLSEHYPTAARTATTQHWPHRRLPLHHLAPNHLAPISHADEVADAIAELCTALVTQPRSSQ